MFEVWHKGDISDSNEISMVNLSEHETALERVNILHSVHEDQMKAVETCWKLSEEGYNAWVGVTDDLEIEYVNVGTEGISVAYLRN